MELLTVCPKCAGTNKPDAKPMINLEPDGRYSCAYCGNLFSLSARDDHAADR